MFTLILKILYKNTQKCNKRRIDSYACSRSSVSFWISSFSFILWAISRAFLLFKSSISWKQQTLSIWTKLFDCLAVKVPKYDTVSITFVTSTQITSFKIRVQDPRLRLLLSLLPNPSPWMSSLFTNPSSHHYTKKIIELVQHKGYITSNMKWKELMG